MARVLVIDDDAGFSLALTLEVEALGHEVSAEPTAERGLRAARAEVPAVVFLDLHLPRKSGLEILPELLGLAPAPGVVVMTSAPTAENAMDALALGARAHASKPLEFAELPGLLERLLEGRPPLTSSARATPRLVGRSPAMLELGRRIGSLARSEAGVLIRGESGTGKELVARALHERSGRAKGPFVAVSCAALPEQLLEAELFGHARGAFTGAHRDRPGRIDLADGGTLFLDEVGELTPLAQGKLLRFLEERTYERVGEDTTRVASVRFLAATNVDLEQGVAAGTFRQDLFYRLDVARIELPPLRERLEDLPLLVEHFLACLGQPGVGLDPEALAALSLRPWPGNVRQLRNAVEDALIELGGGPLLLPEHFTLREHERRAEQDHGFEGAIQREVRAIVGDASQLFYELRERLERTLVQAALERTGGNQVAASRLLGMNRASFRRKLKEFRLLGSALSSGP